MDRYIYKNGKKLKCGFTTGTCAAASAKAAATMLFTKKNLDKITVKLPSSEFIEIGLIDATIVNSKPIKAICCVKKQSGDDPDVTDGILVYVTAKFNYTNEINIQAGKGIGIVTQKGLDCPVGEPAINSVPKRMIIENVMDVLKEFGYKGGIDLLIEVPEGKERAKKTFNPQLGIVGGISIIGTTGIVEPMSEKALIDTLKVEMNVIKEKGYNSILAFPGNYAEKFINEKLKIKGENNLKFGNYLGEVLDYALEMEFKEILIVGHIGKMVKVAGGMMNTHSHTGDFRMEVLGCYSGLYGAESSVIEEILKCVTTESAIEILIREKILNKVIKKISDRALFYLNKRVCNEVKIGLVIYSNEQGILIDRRIE